jgi:hypothetical protein
LSLIAISLLQALFPIHFDTDCAEDEGGARPRHNFGVVPRLQAGAAPP